MAMGMARWREHLEMLVRREAAVFQQDSEDVLRRKLDQYYLPMLQWIDRVIEHTQLDRSHDRRPCVCIGLSCVQGGGKTTATRLFQQMMEFSGRKCAVVSLDDAYVTNAQQRQIAQASPENPLLQLRGNPGTHDIPFLCRFLDECKTSEGLIAVPQYDKALHQGRGDRVDKAEWRQVQGPLDVVLVEGWCLGFRPLASTAGLDPNLIPVNTALREFEALYQALDALIVIQVESPDIVYKWREQQEAQLRLSGKPVLTPAQVRDFVNRYMPAYHTYLPDLYAQPTISSTAPPAPFQFEPSHISTLPRLVVSIDAHRCPTHAAPNEYNMPSPSQ